MIIDEIKTRILVRQASTIDKQEPYKGKIEMAKAKASEPNLKKVKPINSAKVAEGVIEKRDAKKFINAHVKLTKIDMEGPGYLPNFRKVLVYKEAFSSPVSSSLALYDEGLAYLKEHIVKPETEEEKTAFIEQLDAVQIAELFTIIMGADEVSP